MSISKRIGDLIDSLGISKNQFSKEIGTSSAMISQIVSSGKESFRVDLVQKIIKAYPALNVKWLLLGEGSMWVNTIPEIADIDERIREVDDDLLFIHAKLIHMRELFKTRFGIEPDKDLQEEEDSIVLNTTFNPHTSGKELKEKHLANLNASLNKLTGRFWKMFSQYYLRARKTEPSHKSQAT